MFFLFFELCSKNRTIKFVLTKPFFYIIMQIVGKPEKLKSREPLILLGLRLVIQVVLPLGSGGTPVQVQVLSPAPNNRNPIFRVSAVFMYGGNNYKKVLSHDSCIAEGEYLFE
jgi:hypothetical protein